MSLWCEKTGLLNRVKDDVYLPGDWYLVLGPDTGQVDTHAGHDGRRVAQTHRRQVQGVGGHEVGGLGQLLGG